ncbi:MerR family transcriptional regulator [[Ruminococcus] gnavus]|nr:MerR family transcriptional regulator [Lachnospiraceae bacterium]
MRDYVDRGWLACTITPTGRRLFDEEDIEVFKKNYYRKKTGENEQ